MGIKYGKRYVLLNKAAQYEFITGWGGSQPWH